MVDFAKNETESSSGSLLSIDQAIAAIEAGAADEALRVDLGGGLTAGVEGQMGLPGLLQRLRGHKLLKNMSEMANPEQVTAMRSKKTDMHPHVAEILDALDGSD